MLESLALAVLVSLGVYLAMRNWRSAQARRRAAAAPAEPRPTMPRLGTPGTITREQMEALRRCDFEPSREWSAEEAALILDAVTYARAVLRDVTGRTRNPVEAQNATFTFILADEGLRGYLIDWGRNLARRGPRDALPELKRNEHYERVEAFVKSLPGK